MASTDQNRVLLADDQAEIRLMLEAKFRQEGYEHQPDFGLIVGEQNAGLVGRCHKRII